MTGAMTEIIICLPNNKKMKIKLMQYKLEIILIIKVMKET